MLVLTEIELSSKSKSKKEVSISSVLFYYTLPSLISLLLLLLSIPINSLLYYNMSYYSFININSTSNKAAVGVDSNIVDIVSSKRKSRRNRRSWGSSCYNSRLIEWSQE